MSCFSRVAIQTEPDDAHDNYMGATGVLAQPTDFFSLLLACMTLFQIPLNCLVAFLHSRLFHL